MTKENFQQRVAEWLTACFSNREERTHRFIEEALELAQASGCSREDVYCLVDYVFSRPVGQVKLEVGDVMITLAALSAAFGINMNDAANDMLDRNWLRIDAIRNKQANKPTESPLPE
jgi:NTP pyrophosphatase (non-canonical NTP hydrolase)